MSTRRVLSYTDVAGRRSDLLGGFALTDLLARQIDAVTDALIFLSVRIGVLCASFRSVVTTTAITLLLKVFGDVT